MPMNRAQAKSLTRPVIWLWLLWAYVYLAILPALPFLPLSGGLKESIVVLPFTFVVLFAATWAVSGKGPFTPERMRSGSLAAIVALVSILAIDVAYGLFLNASTGLEVGSGTSDESRLANGEIFIGEYRPRVYYPTDRDFRLFKPNFTVTADAYGQVYDNDMKSSALIMDTILEKQRITMSIDEHGFRETTTLKEARIFALGDSFTEGHTISQENTWVDRLENLSGQPTYNLGVSDSSPRQELMVLQYLLEEHTDDVEIDTLIWMIFEGNDLEDSYRINRPSRIGEPVTMSVMSGSVAELIDLVPRKLREGSFINRAMTGRLISPVEAEKSRNSDIAFEFDGVALKTPLLTSETFGYRFFNQTYINNAARDETYVREHPNASYLRQTFDDMQSLAEQNGFDVIVAIAPTAPRLYKNQYAGLGDVAADAHFINMVEEFAGEQGFQVINLNDELTSYAETELLYARDDAHWNKRGNEVVAELIADALATR